jgi:hypothetical protein
MHALTKQELDQVSTGLIGFGHGPRRCDEDNDSKLYLCAGIPNRALKAGFYAAAEWATSGVVEMTSRAALSRIQDAARSTPCPKGYATVSDGIQTMCRRIVPDQAVPGMEGRGGVDWDQVAWDRT